MTAAVAAPPAVADPGGRSSRSARRAVARWAWRLFLREWRQQILILGLLTVAVAATVVGLGLATNAPKPATTTLVLPTADPQLPADLAAIDRVFGPVPVVDHQRVPVPGSVSSLDVRAESTNGGRGWPDLSLVKGRFPAGPGQVAMTGGVASLLGLRIGDTWTGPSRQLRLVGLVENPQNLSDQFALVAPGQVQNPDLITVQLVGPVTTARGFRLPSGTPLGVEQLGNSPTQAAAVVLTIAALGLMFVGLLAAAGFMVMAQRRLRAVGMLSAIGATDRHVRTSFTVNGAATGLSGAVAGAGAGLAVWLILSPGLQSAVGHRVDRFNLPWWAIGVAMLLAVLTAVAASWWPARMAVRMPVVSALSGRRPARSQPARRSALLGVALLAGGLTLLWWATDNRTVVVLGGTVATVVGALLLAPLALRLLGPIGARVPVSARVAWRDLVRYQSRSGVTLAAITLAVVIASTTAVETARQEAGQANRVSNLPANQMVLHAGGTDVVDPMSAAQLRSAEQTASRIAALLQAPPPLVLEQAYNQSLTLPAGPGAGPAAAATGGGYPSASLDRFQPVPHGFMLLKGATLYLATPQLLAHYGIGQSSMPPGTDVITSLADTAGMQLDAGPPRAGAIQHPVIRSAPLPSDTSDPNSLITPGAVAALGLATVPTGWLLQTRTPLSPAQIATARGLAAAAGLRMETTNPRQSLDRVGSWATIAGILLALGVLAMAVGLIRSETVGDLRTLAATGAGPVTRRNLTAVTAGTLALLGAVLGVATSYAALAIWFHGSLHGLTNVPLADLVAIVVGLPLVATAGGWVLAGRQPPALSRQPLD